MVEGENWLLWLPQAGCVAHAVSVWAVTRCRVFLIPCCLCYMSEARTDICLTWLPFQCLSDLMNKYLWVHTQECQEPDFHRSFQWPTPPKPQLPRSFLQMRYGVGGVHCTHFFRLVSLESFLFSFCLWVSTSSLANWSSCYYTTWFWRMGHLSDVAHGDFESILHKLFKRGETQILPVISNFTQGFCGFVCLFVCTLLKLYLRVLGGSVGFKLKCEDLRLDTQLPCKSLTWPVTSALWGTEAGDSLGLAANLVKKSASSKVLWQALTQGNMEDSGLHMSTPIYMYSTHKMKRK